MIKTASFPTAPWDGVTNFRPDRDTSRPPDREDWDEMMAEMIAVETSLYAMTSDLVIWAAPHAKSTGTGSLTNPYTLAAAIAAVSSTKKTICLMPGTYTTVASTTLPTLTGCKIIGIGGSSVTIIDHTTAGDEALNILPANAAAYEITLEGIRVQALATADVLAIDDTGATATTGTITVNLKDVELVYDTSGGAIVTTHAVALDLTIVAEDCLFVGLVGVVCVSATDVFTFRKCRFPDGLTSTGAYAAVHTFTFCDFKENSIAGNAAAIAIALYCTAVDETLIANDTDVHTFAGSGTLITPTSA